MQDKEIKNWQNEQALKRYQLITPLLDPDVDERKAETAAGRDRPRKQGYRSGHSTGDSRVPCRTVRKD